MKDLKTLAEFKAALKAGRLLGSTDSSLPDAIHVPPCPSLNDAAWAEKMEKAEGKKGRFYTYDSIEDALGHIGDRPCPKCLKGIPSLRGFRGEWGGR